MTPAGAGLRIVFLTHNFPRFAGDVSGAFLATLAQALRARGHDIRVIAPRDRGQAGDPTFEGIPIRRVAYASPAREDLAYRGTMARAARSPGGAWRALTLGRALHRAAARALAEGAQLVHAHWWVPAGLAAPRGRPLVLTVHGTDGAILSRSAAARLVARALFRRATVVTAVSPTTARLVRRATGRDISPAHQHPMPVQTALFRWSRRGGGLIVIARLTPQKRVELAIRAVAVLGDQAPDLPLTVVGDGPERGRLERLSGELQLEGRIRFLGAQPPDRIADLLGSADLAVFPAREEGFGLSAAEAFMAGVPVVACRDGGGVLDIVPATGAGRQVEPEPEAIARAIGDLLHDPDAITDARARGMEWRHRLAPAHVAEVCEGWYREALGA